MASAQGDSTPVKCEISPRNKLYLNISENLSEDQVKSLRAMLITDHHIAKAKIETATPHEIFNMLEDDHKIGEGNLGFLIELLKALGKTQLAQELEKMERRESEVTSKRKAPEDASSPKQPRMGRDDDSDSSVESGIGGSSSSSPPENMETDEPENDGNFTAESTLTTVGDVRKRIEYLRKKYAKLTRYPNSISETKAEELSKVCKETEYLVKLLKEQVTGELKVDIALLDTETQEFQGICESGALHQEIGKEVKQILLSTSDDVVRLKPNVKIDFTPNTSENTNYSPGRCATIKVNAEDVELADSCKLDKDSAVRHLFKYLVENSHYLRPILKYLNSFFVQVRTISYGSIDFECLCLTPESAIRLQEEYDGKQLKAEIQRVISSLAILEEVGIKSISLAVKLKFANEGPLSNLKVTSNNDNSDCDIEVSNITEHGSPWTPVPDGVKKISGSKRFFGPIDNEEAIESLQSRLAQMDVDSHHKRQLDKSTYSTPAKNLGAVIMASAQGSSSPVKCELSPRSKLYLKISQNLSEEQVKHLRVLLSNSNHIAKGRIENATAHEIFTMLEANNKIGEGNLGLLKDLLIALNEGQLANEVGDLERGQLADISKLHSKHGFKVEELKPKGGGKAVQGSSIPLILPNDLKYNASTGEVEKVQGAQRATLHVVPEALELLEGIEEPVSVLAICGPCRTGKSYILSRLLGTADAFELGHSMETQTFGIWMGTKVLRGKDFTIVLLDTEGIDAVAGNAGLDASILVMTILLSSQLIYNSLNVPHKGDLEKMQCFIELAKRVTVKQGEKIQTSEFHEFFPQFLWLLRDVTLKMLDDAGKDMDPTEYLKTKVLQGQGDEGGFNESTSDKVGRAICTFFPSVECTTLEKPSGDTKVINNITQHTGSLNPGFNKGVHALTERLLQKARAKRGYDKDSTVSGEALSIMAKQYVEAVNTPGCIPALDNTWKITIEVMRVRAIEEAVKEYNEQMQSLVARATNNGQVPLEESVENGKHGRHSTSQSTLMDLHQKLLSKVTDKLLEKVGHFGISSEDQSSEDNKLVERMQNRLVQRKEQSVDCVAEDGTTRKQESFVVTGGELLQYIQQNKQLSKNFCQDLCEQLLDPIRKQVESPPPNLDFDKLKGEIADALQQYEEKACGPERSIVQDEMIKSIKKLNTEIEKIKGYQSKIMQERKKAHEAELRAEEKEMEMQKKMQEMEKQQRKQIEKMEQQHGLELLKIRLAKMELAKERDESTKKMEQEQDVIQRELEELKPQNQELLKQLQDKQQENEQMRRELEELERKNAEMEKREIEAKRKSFDLEELLKGKKAENENLQRELNERKPQNEQVSKQVDDMQQTQQKTQPKMERQHSEQIEEDQLKEEPPKRREGQEPADMSRDLEENKSSQTPSSTSKTKKKGNGCTIS